MNDPRRPETILDPNTTYDAIGYEVGDAAIHCFAQQNGAHAVVNNNRTASLTPQPNLTDLADQGASSERIEERLDRHEAYAHQPYHTEQIDAVNDLIDAYRDRTKPLTIRARRHEGFNAIEKHEAASPEPKNTLWAKQRRHRHAQRGYGIALVLDETYNAAHATMNALQDDIAALQVYEDNDEAPKQLDDRRNPRHSLRKNAEQAFDNVSALIEAVNQAHDHIHTRINTLTKDFDQRQRQELQAQYQNAVKAFYE